MLFGFAIDELLVKCPFHKLDWARSLAVNLILSRYASAVEEIVGGFARSVHTMSNTGTHGSKERAGPLWIRRYVIVVLRHILAISE